MKEVWLRYEHQQLSQLHDEYVFSVVARCDFSLLRVHVHVLEKRICIYMHMYIASLYMKL